MFFFTLVATTLTTIHHHHSPGCLQRPGLHSFFLHVVKSVLNTSLLSETLILSCSESLCLFTKLEKHLKPLAWSQAWKPLWFNCPSCYSNMLCICSTWSLCFFWALCLDARCLVSFTQFWPSCNSGFIKITYSITAAYHRKLPHSPWPMVSSPSLFLSGGLVSHLFPHTMMWWNVFTG